MPNVKMHTAVKRGDIRFVRVTASFARFLSQSLVLSYRVDLIFVFISPQFVMKCDDNSVDSNKQAFGQAIGVYIMIGKNIKHRGKSVHLIICICFCQQKKILFALKIFFHMQTIHSCFEIYAAQPQKLMHIWEREKNHNHITI